MQHKTSKLALIIVLTVGIIGSVLWGIKWSNKYWVVNNTFLIVQEVAFYTEHNNGCLPPSWNALLTWSRNNPYWNTGVVKTLTNSELDGRYRLAWGTDVRGVILSGNRDGSPITDAVELSNTNPIFFLKSNEHEMSWNKELWGRFIVIYQDADLLKKAAIKGKR